MYNDTKNRPIPVNLRYRLGVCIAEGITSLKASKRERYRMFSLKKMALAISASAIAATGIAIGTGTAHAATPSCGSSCVEPFNHEWGRNIVLATLGGGDGVNHQPISMFRASNGLRAEDFTYSFQGTVATLVADGLLPNSFLVHYAADPAFELTYSPLGDDDPNGTGPLCVSTWSPNPAPGNLLRLQPCGLDRNTLWIVDSLGINGNRPGFANIIAGSTVNFSDPLVWTYPDGVTPFDTPRPIVKVQRLRTFAGGVHPANQQWSARFGILP